MELSAKLLRTVLGAKPSSQYGHMPSTCACARAQPSRLRHHLLAAGVRSDLVACTPLALVNTRRVSQYPSLYPCYWGDMATLSVYACCAPGAMSASAAHVRGMSSSRW